MLAQVLCTVGTTLLLCYFSQLQYLITIQLLCCPQHAQVCHTAANCASMFSAVLHGCLQQLQNFSASELACGRKLAHVVCALHILLAYSCLQQLCYGNAAE
jgi:hypothetical protein